MAYDDPIDTDDPGGGEKIRLGAGRIRDLAIALKQRLASIFVDPDADPLVLKPSSVSATQIADGSITTIKLVDDSVTSAKIVDGAISDTKILGHAVTTAKIAIGAVTDQELAVGAVTAVKVAALAIATASLQDDSVTVDKLAAGAVVTTSIVDNAVTNLQIADNAISTRNLQDDCVTNAEIADDAVRTLQIQNDAVTTAKILDGNVTASKLAALAVATGNIQAAAVTRAKLEASISAGLVVHLAGTVTVPGSTVLSGTDPNADSYQVDISNATVNALPANGPVCVAPDLSAAVGGTRSTPTDGNIYLGYVTGLPAARVIRIRVNSSNTADVDISGQVIHWSVTQNLP